MSTAFTTGSKFKNLNFVAKFTKREDWYDGISVSGSSQEHNSCCVNSKFIAIVLDSGGGSNFLVLPIHQTGKVHSNFPKICGHSKRVSDLKWNPFDDNVIATGSENGVIKLWHIPDGGLISDLNESLIVLSGHQDQVAMLKWHPVAENILASVGCDNSIILWDISKGRQALTVSCHPDAITDFSWNRTGSHFATTCRDNKIRVIDPRKQKVIIDAPAHPGSRTSQICFLDQNLLLTTGLSQSGVREMCIWSTSSMTKPEVVENVDKGADTLNIYLDQDTNIVYLVGRGDLKIKIYEVTTDPIGIHFLGEIETPVPFRCLAVMPKRHLRVAQCEIYRFYKLHNNAVEPISILLPRGEETGFQGDIYPPTQGNTPTLDASQWLIGRNEEPILISLRDKYEETVASATPYYPTIELTKDRISATSHKDTMVTTTAASTTSGNSTVPSRVRVQQTKVPVGRWSATEFQSKRDMNQRLLLQSSSMPAPRNEEELREMYHLLQSEVRFLTEEMEKRDFKIRSLEAQLAQCKLNKQDS